MVMSVDIIECLVSIYLSSGCKLSWSGAKSKRRLTIKFSLRYSGLPMVSYNTVNPMVLGEPGEAVK